MTRPRALSRVTNGDAGSPREAPGRALPERGSPDPDWLRAHAPDGDLSAPCDVIRQSAMPPTLADRPPTRWSRARLADEGA